ncbi:MAG: hypothetical protein HKM93_02660 [Desulfobacteraceae bacterium]|nr:hypothetical protein [Desulfobacteraceae bacterium]
MPKDKKSIKKDILDKFREMDAEAGHVLPEGWLQDEYYTSLDAFDQKSFKQAVKELITKDLVVKVDKPQKTLKLTGKGADLIH